MDKQQATDFILKRLELGYKKESIAEELSSQLKAPSAVVAKFVDQVAANFQPKPPQQPAPRPAQADIPSWILDLEEQGSPTELIRDDISDSQQALKSPQSFQDLNRPSSENLLVNPPSSLSEAEVNLISTPQKEIDTEELTAFVLQELKRQRRLNDIIEIVCQRTGWHWNEAQRFVARAKTTHHGAISKSQNRFMIPFSVVFILGGILLLIWAITALVDYYLGYTSLDHSSTLSADFIPVVLGALVTSLGIIAGGIYGLYRTLASR